MQILDKGYIELIDHMGNDNTIVNAARVSFLGESKGEEQDRKLIRYLLKNKHTSPLEQVEFQFMVKCPLFVARQWMRHRTFNFNEVSRRYTSEEIDFYIPSQLRKQAENDKQASDGVLTNLEAEDYILWITNNCDNALDDYNTMVSHGVAREQARMILPQNMYTSFYAKTDLHNLFHFIELRNSEHSQYEIRVYAEAIEQLIQPIVPVAFEEWKKLNP